MSVFILRLQKQNRQVICVLKYADDLELLAKKKSYNNIY